HRNIVVGKSYNHTEQDPSPFPEGDTPLHRAAEADRSDWVARWLLIAAPIPTGGDSAAQHVWLGRNYPGTRIWRRCCANVAAPTSFSTMSFALRRKYSDSWSSPHGDSPDGCARVWQPIRRV